LPTGEGRSSLLGLRWRGGQLAALLEIALAPTLLASDEAIA
jgi:hypothetical protein